MIAILRRCRRCYEWRCIESFKPLGRLCQECVFGRRQTDQIALTRALVLTPKGRAAVKELAA